MNNLKINNRKSGMSTRDLRDAGHIPGVVFGPTIDSMMVKVHHQDLRKAFDKKGEVYQITTKSRVPVFVKFDEVQKDPVTGEFIHFSLLEMPKGITNEVDIPVNFDGTPEGVKKGGVLLVLKNEIPVQGKPRSMPTEIKVEVNDMEIGDKLTVDDLDIPNKVEVMIDGSSPNSM